MCLCPTVATECTHDPRTRLRLTRGLQGPEQNNCVDRDPFLATQVTEPFIRFRFDIDSLRRDAQVSRDIDDHLRRVRPNLGLLRMDRRIHIHERPARLLDESIGLA